jgi:ABC-type branched-subunit amino acid transport system substrate-binding protein
VSASQAFGMRRLAERPLRRAKAFNVGLLIPSTGAMGLLGPGAYACARLARDLWNQHGGVDGQEVRLTVVDASETAPRMTDDLEELLGNRELDAIVALTSTPVCQEIAAVVRRRVPLIYTPHFEGVGLPDWVHAIGETPERQLLPAIDWMRERHRARRWYLIGNDYCWPRRIHSLAIPALRASGAEVVRERYVAVGERDFVDLVDDMSASRADILLISLLSGDAIHLCRAFEHAGLGGRVLRLSTGMEENAVLGVGEESSEGMYVSAGYFAALESASNCDFRERYHAWFGERAPALSSLSQSVYEGFVHLQRQAQPGMRPGQAGYLRGIRDDCRGAFDPRRNPIFLGEVRGLGISPVRRLVGEPG